MLRLRENSLPIGVLQRHIPVDNGQNTEQILNAALLERGNGGITQQSRDRNVFNSLQG